MNAIIDTSSLMALVRYYLPFDKDNALKGLFQNYFESGSLVIIDKVVEEAGYQAQGLIIDSLEFLSQYSECAKQVHSTVDLLPYQRFINRLDNEFCDKDFIKAKGLHENRAQYEVARKNYLDSADAKIILYADKENRKNSGSLFSSENRIWVITEETPYGNDNKPFKKIPAICKLMDIDCCTLPVFMKKHYKLNLSGFFH